MNLFVVVSFSDPRIVAIEVQGCSESYNTIPYSFSFQRPEAKGAARCGGSN